MEAAVFFIDRADATMGPSEGKQEPAAITSIICVICQELAALIGDANSWRIPALVGSSRILSRRFGWQEAALRSAQATRDFTASLPGPGHPFDIIATQVALAVSTRQEMHLDLAVSAVREHLTSQPRLYGSVPVRPLSREDEIGGERREERRIKRAEPEKLARWSRLRARIRT